MSPERAIQQVLARYCRAVDARDGAALYTPDGTQRISYHRAGEAEPLISFDGASAIEKAVSTVLPPHPPHPPLGWGRHLPVPIPDEDNS